MALNGAENGPIHLIYRGKLKIEEKPDPEENIEAVTIQKEKEKLNKFKKAEYIKELKRKIHEQRLADTMTNKDYTIRMEEIKRLEVDKDFDWTAISIEQ